jgi:hypothetical protein
VISDFVEVEMPFWPELSTSKVTIWKKQRRRKKKKAQTVKKFRRDTFFSGFPGTER